MKSYIAFSGGVESTTMALLFGHQAQAVFCDTGAEHQEMYDRLETVERIIGDIHPRFCIERIKAYRPDGKDVDNLPDYIRSAKVFPSQTMRFCTKYFKILPLNKFLEDKRPCSLMIGLNSEETDRTGNHGLEGVAIEYPLQDLGLTRSACLRLLENYELEPALPPYMRRGGCTFCPYKSRREYAAIVHLNPQLASELAAFEEEINSGKRNTRKKFWAMAPSVPEGMRTFMANEKLSLFNGKEMYTSRPDIGTIETSCGVFCHR